MFYVSDVFSNFSVNDLTLSFRFKWKRFYLDMFVYVIYSFNLGPPFQPSPIPWEEAGPSVREGEVKHSKFLFLGV